MARSLQISKIVIAISALIIIAIVPSELRAEKGLRIGFAVGSHPEAVIDQWKPLIDYISTSLNLPVEIVIRNSFDGLIDGMRRGEIDITVAGQLQYVLAEKAIAAKLIAGAVRDTTTNYDSIIAVRKDSNLRSLEDLRGHSFAFTDLYSNSGYLVPRIIMAKNGITQPLDYFSEVTFTGHHSASLEALYDGRVDAAAISSYFLDANSKGDDLLTITSGGPQAPEPIFARSDLDPKLSASLQRTLIDISQQVSSGIMKKLQITSFKKVIPEDYIETRRKLDELNALPAARFTLEYNHAPKELRDLLVRKVHHAWITTLLVPSSALLIFILATISFNKRIRKDLRLQFFLGLMGIIIAISFVISTISAVGLERRFGEILARWTGAINTFSLQLGQAADSLQSEDIKPYVTGLMMQPGFIFVQIIRDGTILAASDDRDVGASIVPQILAGIFPNMPNRAPNEIVIQHPIESLGKAWGQAVIGLDAGLLNTTGKLVLWGNVVAVFMLIFSGALFALIFSSRIVRPILDLSRTVVRIGEGDNTDIPPSKRIDQIGQLEDGLRSMNQAIRRQEELLQLKASELDTLEEHLTQQTGHTSFIEDTIEDIAAGEEVGAERLRTEIEVIRERSDVLKCTLSERNNELSSKIAELESEIPLLREIRTTKVIGVSPAFLTVIRDIVIRSRDDDPVLIVGESGAGKTGIAEAIHALGRRSNRKFFECNCAEFAAADPVIVLGKLFGYGKGSGIQGIDSRGQPGLLEECDGATLFFDEIQLLPAEAQAMLLFPLEGRSFNPAAGRGEPRKVDVRFIFATNVHLQEEIASGRFRNDLLRRLKARGMISIPPLRKRMEDIEPLVNHFLDILRRERGIELSIEKEALSLLCSYDYHSFNVAELSTAVKVGADQAMFHGRRVIESIDLPEEINRVQTKPAQSAQISSMLSEEELREILVLRKHAFRIAPSEVELNLSPDSKTLTHHLRGIIFKLLSQLEWKSEAAAMALTGESIISDTSNRMSRKIERYLNSAKEAASDNSAQRLLYHLPQPYHEYIYEAIERAKK